MNRNMENKGELEIIRYLRKRFPKRRNEIIKGIGDDAMVFRDGYVITTDSFFEKTHFDMAYFSFFNLGYHTMAASLSDIAAMAASPISVLISLCISRKIGMAAIRELYDGFSELTRKYRCDISGGDIVKCPTLGVTITVIGRTKAPLLRSGAKPGNSLYVTNFLGLAEAGRIALQNKYRESEYPDAMKKHLFPEPRIKEAFKIAKYATSCIDTSDGLSTDAFHLAEESGAKIIIEAEHIPIHSEVGKLCAAQRMDPTQFILSAGEDFELLFTAPKLPKISGVTVFRIGRVMKGKGLFLSAAGRERPIRPSGYQHI
ncbi:MAG: thiamine-phosphate kinase [candidate division WOR-3 bacterium]|nr:thiamine-phosphate kinase [candidate division WOR-3 bacterium]